jgi:hypothetical protein
MHKATTFEHGGKVYEVCAIDGSPPNKAECATHRLSLHRPEYMIPKRCADAVVSSRESVVASVMLK